MVHRGSSEHQRRAAQDWARTAWKGQRTCLMLTQRHEEFRDTLDGINHSTEQSRTEERSVNRRHNNRNYSKWNTQERDWKKRKPSKSVSCQTNLSAWHTCDLVPEGGDREGGTENMNKNSTNFMRSINTQTWEYQWSPSMRNMQKTTPKPVRQTAPRQHKEKMLSTARGKGTIYGGTKMRRQISYCK